MRPLRIPAVSRQGEQEKQHAKQILALGYPGNRFDIDGMQGEERSHHSAAPDEAGCRSQYPKQQQYIKDVENYVRAMMPCRIEIKELVIERVGQPCHGMPVSCVVGGERPFDRLPAESALDMVFAVT